MTSPQPVAPETPPPARYPFWTYQDLVFLIGLGIPCLFLAVGVTSLLKLVVPGWQKPAVTALSIQFVAYILWFFALWGLFRLRYERSFRQALRWTRPRLGMAIFITLGFVLAIAIVLIGLLLRTPDIEMPMKELLSDRLSLILVGTFAVTLGPVCEELAFRGFLLPLLVRSFGAAAGILISGVTFGLMHGPQYAWSWKHLALISLAGCVFGVVRVVTGSTAAAAAMHAGYNLTFFVAYLYQWQEFAS